MSLGHEEVRFTAEAIRALQESAEAFIVHLLAEAYIAAIHAKRITLQIKDMELACHILRIDGMSDRAARAATGETPPSRWIPCRGSSCARAPG